MPNHGKYPDELRERAVRMVFEHEHEYPSQWAAICSVADKLGPKPETVRGWVRQAERDHGRPLGRRVPVRGAARHDVGPRTLRHRTRTGPLVSELRHHLRALGDPRHPRT